VAHKVHQLLFNNRYYVLTKFSMAYGSHMDGYSGPSPGFRSRGAKNQEGPKSRSGGHIFEITVMDMCSNRGPKMKWGGTDFKWGGRAPLAPPLATTLRLLHLRFNSCSLVRVYFKLRAPCC